jgi:hypothetical protein
MHMLTDFKGQQKSPVPDSHLSTRQKQDDYQRKCPITQASARKEELQKRRQAQLRTSGHGRGTGKAHHKKRSNDQAIYDEHGNLTAAEAIRRAQKYFEEHPTLLKPFHSEPPNRDRNGSSNKHEDRYPIKNPYYEDTQCYDLDHCIKMGGMLPVFGYPLMRFGERPRFDFNMLMPNIVGYLREKQ